MTLTELGWSNDFNQHFREYGEQGYVPARVVREHTHIYAVRAESGAFSAEVSGRLRHAASSKSDFPAVGDWVAIAARPEEGKATIHAVLPRRSVFARKEAGARTQEQVVAANIDTAFLVSGLDGDFNPRRVERYLTLAWDSGAKPVIVLNKADMCDDIAGCVAEIEAVAFGVPILPVSATDGQGVDALRRHLGTGVTAAFLGSSGVGKSTLINALIGEQRQDTGAVREDDSRGRHTTTYRELILLPGGGVVMDTPGMRELQLWVDEDGLARTFDDIETLALECRFRDCTHTGEPGCAIGQAIEDGTLAAARWDSYLRLQRELESLAARQNGKARLLEKARWKKLAVERKRINKLR